jgi:hypothetical protein
LLFGGVDASAMRPVSLFERSAKGMSFRVIMPQGGATTA